MQGEFIEKPYLWGLDPLFHAHVKIVAKMLQHMIPGRGTGLADPPVWFYSFVNKAPPRPIRLVAIGGVVVQKHEYKKTTRFLLDDGSGCANCMYWNDSYRDVVGEDIHIELGQFVHVLGRLEWRHGHSTIVASRVQIARSANAETNWWNDLTSVHEKIYSKPFKLPLPSCQNAESTN